MPDPLSIVLTRTYSTPRYQYGDTFMLSHPGSCSQGLAIQFPSVSELRRSLAHHAVVCRPVR